MGEALLIVNPKSGVDGHKDFVVGSAVALSEKRGLRLDIEYTKGPGDARRLASEAAREGRRCVVVAGGDGTIRDAADGVWGSDTVLGIVPLGSGNGLARSMSVSQMAEKAIEIAFGDNFATIDRGAANSMNFYSAFGVGFDAEVSYRFSLDKRRGRTTYIKHALREIFSYQPRRFRIEIGQSVIETEAMLVAVCNCPQYGNNAYIAPKADPADGILDITVIHSGNFFATMIAGIDLFSGTLDRNVLVENFRASAVKLCEEGAPPKIITHLDGEPTEMSDRIDIECHPRGLKVAVPKDIQPFKPFFTPVKSMVDDMILDIRKKIHSSAPQQKAEPAREETRQKQKKKEI